MTADYTQWIRKIGLILSTGSEVIDMSAFRIRFHVMAADFETPNNITIRVYNLASELVTKLTKSGEFTDVQLSAGYENGNFGAIFTGTVKQYRVGKENSTTTYLDILAADGDIPYNRGIVSQSLQAGTVTLAEQAKAAAKAAGTLVNFPLQSTESNRINYKNLRGVVQYGMMKSLMRNIASSLDSTWSIKDGVVVIKERTGYSFGEAVELNVNTGLISTPEQMEDGINITCLLNSRIRTGGLVKIDNSTLNQLIAAGKNTVNTPFNKRVGLQYNAPTDADGVYEVFAIEHEGDSRGQAWYSHLTCLAVDLTKAINQVSAN